MKSKLGIYLISLGGLDVTDYFSVARPRIALSMEHNPDTWRAIKRVSPNTFIIGRHYVDDPDQIFSDDPEGRAQAFFNQMRPNAEKMRGLYDAWMGQNEPVINSPAQATALSRFYVRWGDLMRAAGLHSCAYSFASGNPDLSLWPYLLDGLRHCDILSLHEYGAPTMETDSTWLCLRYRKVWNLLPPDARRLIAITECGIDGGTIGRPQEGWRRITNEAGYLSSLQWYDHELQNDAYIIGGTIFAANGWGVQGSFGMGEVKSIRDYIAQGGNPAPIVLPPPNPTTPPPTPSPATYVVKRGDSLSVIAKKFGVTVAALVAANNITNPNIIQIGQFLVIPKPGKVLVATYVVRRGDTLQSIARMFGVSLTVITKANSISSTGAVQPGQVLKIPTST